MNYYSVWFLWVSEWVSNIGGTPLMIHSWSWWQPLWLVSLSCSRALCAVKKMSSGWWNLAWITSADLSSLQETTLPASVTSETCWSTGAMDHQASSTCFCRHTRWILTHNKTLLEYALTIKVVFLKSHSTILWSNSITNRCHVDAFSDWSTFLPHLDFWGSSLPGVCTAVWWSGLALGSAEEGLWFVSWCRR